MISAICALLFGGIVAIYANPNPDPTPKPQYSYSSVKNYECYIGCISNVAAVFVDNNNQFPIKVQWTVKNKNNGKIVSGETCVKGTENRSPVGWWSFIRGGGTCSDWYIVKHSATRIN